MASITQLCVLLPVVVCCCDAVKEAVQPFGERVDGVERELQSMKRQYIGEDPDFVPSAFQARVRCGGVQGVCMRLLMWMWT